MASPFSIFRRYQKTMLAVLTLLAMFAFVFLDPLLQAFQGDAGPEAVVVATRRYGNLSEHDVRSLLHQRQVVLNVLERALTAGGVPATFATFQVQQLFGPPTEEEVVYTWLFAQRAEDVGMTVDDRAVNEFLNSFLEMATEGQVSVGDLASILARDRIPQRTLFASLRKELLARQLRQSFQTSLWAVPPMQRWDYYLRLNRRATIELLPVSVADFMDEIDHPDERTLQAFFEEHKGRLWRPDMPEPAFREPQKIALQYFKAEFEEFVDPAAVPEEEVLQYYEENKDVRYLQPEAPTPQEPDAPDDEQQEEPAAEIPADPEAMDAEPSVEEPEDNATPTPEEVEPTGEPSAGEPTEDLSTTLEEVQPTDEVELADEVEPADEAEPIDEVEPADEVEPTDAVEPTDEIEPTDETEPADAPEPPRSYVPLSEVEEEIRFLLARRKASEAIEPLLRSLSVRMQRYQDELTLYEVRRIDDPTAEPPPELDMGKLAAEHGLKSFQTDLLSPWEVRALDIGNSLVEGSEPFIRYAFEALPLFQPAISQADEHYFLSWKTEEQEERIPNWEDPNVQEQVLEAWKLVQAREPARARAQTLAETVRESGTTLTEYFADEPGHDVVQAGPFGWLTFGDIPPMLAREPPRISEVEGVDFTGQPFMRDVFSLEEGELGVTMNQPQTFAYVVRMRALDPPRAILWEGFLVDDFSKYASARAPDFQQMQVAWQRRLEDAAGLEWKREPWRGRDRN